MFVCAGILFAASLSAENWSGDFTVEDPSGIALGEWRGVIFPFSSANDPTNIRGEWAIHNIRGTFDGVVEADNVIRRYAEGDIYDEHGTVIGRWRGYFPPSTIDAQARGTWILFNEQYDGRWVGERQ